MGLDVQRGMSTRLIACASVIVIGCSNPPEPDVTSVESAMSRGDLENEGWDCEYVSEGLVLCSLCGVDSEGLYRCLREECENDECVTCGTLRGDPPCVGLVQHAEQFFFFEAEAGSPQGAFLSSSALDASRGIALGLQPIGGGTATHGFTVGMSSTFSVWARVQVPSTSATSVAVRFDGMPTVAWTPTTTSGWAWQRVPHDFALATGGHSLRIQAKGAGALVDRWLVTDNSDFVPYTASLEAEGNAYLPPMQFATTAGTTYAWVPDGLANAGSVLIAAPVRVDGRYYVWGRVNAPSGSADSFFVNGDLSDVNTRIRWDITNTNATQWRWAEVTAHGESVPTAMSISGGNGFVRFDTREDGTKLDRIFVTNDPGFTPVEPVTK